MASVATRSFDSAPCRFLDSMAVIPAAQVSTIRATTQIIRAICGRSASAAGTLASGSGRMETAAMAVKCMPTMASTNRPVPAAPRFRSGSRPAANSDAIASPMPITIEAVT